MRRPLIATALLSMAACRGAEAPATDATAHGGTLVVASAADADVLFPPLVAGLEGKQVVDQIFDLLADVPDDLSTVGDRGYSPRLAERWTWAPDSLSIAFHIDPRARFHDGQPVRAGDVRFSWQLITDSLVASPHAGGLANIDSIAVRDSLTAVVHFRARSPEQFFQAVYNLPVMPEHLLKDADRATLRSHPFARNPVGSGPFRFARWEPGTSIELVADTVHWRQRPNLDRIVWRIAPNPLAAATQLVQGEVDLVDPLRGGALAQVAGAPDIRLQPYASLDYGYLGFNLRDARGGDAPHPVFGDRGVRRALAMAVDRPALVLNALDTLGYPSLGPVTRAQSTADPELRLPSFDTAASSRLLDSLGWRDADGDGVRERAGRRLAFSLLVPTSSSTRTKMAVLLQQQLAAVGAKVEVEQVEATTFFERLRTHRFDAMLNAWRTDPSPASVRQAWGSAARGAEGANFTGYASPAFDALVDSASTTFDAARSRELFRKAYATIAEDAPAVFIYELRNAAGVHRRLRTVGLRADAWWAHLDRWSIPEAERIPRDRLGAAVRTASR